MASTKVPPKVPPRKPITGMQKSLSKHKSRIQRESAAGTKLCWTPLCFFSFSLLYVFFFIALLFFLFFHLFLSFVFLLYFFVFLLFFPFHNFFFLFFTRFLFLFIILLFHSFHILFFFPPFPSIFFSILFLFVSSFLFPNSLFFCGCFTVVVGVSCMFLFCLLFCSVSICTLARTTWSGLNLTVRQSEGVPTHEQDNTIKTQLQQESK